MKKKLFRPMNETEILIRKIDNIRMLHIYELTGSKPGESSTGCTALAVYYGENEQINLSNQDMYFDDLVNRVFEIYNSLDNKDLIIMDANTKAIMESGSIECGEERFSCFFNGEALTTPEIFLDSALSKRFLPLVEYLLVGIYKIFDVELTITKKEDGWRGSALIAGYIGDNNRKDEENRPYRKDKNIYIKVHKQSDNSFAIMVSEFLIDHGDLLINVVINSDSMNITYYSEYAKFNGTSTFVFSEDKLRETHAMYLNGKQMFYDINDYENMINSESGVLTANEQMILMNEEQISAIYRLPFDMTCVLYNSATYSFPIKRENTRISYIWCDGYYSEERSFETLQNVESNINIKVNSAFVIRVKHRDGRFQTHFVPCGGSASGIYKDKLQGKYFID